MTIDNLLLLAFTNNWYALQNLLQNYNVTVMKSERDSTVISVDNNIIDSIPDFFDTMDDTTLVYMSERIGKLTYIKVYYK